MVFSSRNSSAPCPKRLRGKCFLGHFDVSRILETREYPSFLNPRKRLERSEVVDRLERLGTIRFDCCLTLTYLLFALSSAHRGLGTITNNEHESRALPLALVCCPHTSCLSERSD